MKVAVIGPKGQCGSCVVDELLMRGHDVVGVSRNPPSSWPGVTTGSYSAIAIDIFSDHQGLVDVFSAGFDAIVCAFAPSLSNMAYLYIDCVEAHGRMKTALLASSHTGPFLIIGGAGSLHIKEGVQLADSEQFAFGWWWTWPDAHLDYMVLRMAEHGNMGLSWFCRVFKWARNHVRKPNLATWILSPLIIRPFLWRARKLLTDKHVVSLITGSRTAFTMWRGVTEKSWTFLSPPGLLRDKGIRSGHYELFLDEPNSPASGAVLNGIYNEDMAVAIVDEVENNKLEFKHWSCTGPLDTIEK